MHSLRLGATIAARRCMSSRTSVGFGTVAQGETAAEQVHGCFELIGQSIKDAGGRGLEDVVITRMIAANVVGDLDELAKAHHQVFSAVGIKPAQTTFGGKLVRDWIKVEIEATAIVGS